VADPHAVLREYAPLLDKLNAYQKAAGEFLTMALDPESVTDAVINRSIAEEYAGKALAVRRELKAWRLAHGYER
jgi:hypothetical protein